MKNNDILDNPDTTSAYKNKVEEFVANLEKKSGELEPLQMDRYGFGAWSISKLKVLQKCPLQFFLQYVLKIKVPPEIGVKEDSLSADIGSAAHRVLEFVMKGRDLDTSYALTKKEFVPKTLSEEEWITHVVPMEGNILAFKQRMDEFDVRHKVKRILTEMRLGVTKDWEPCAFFDSKAYFRGIIDLCLLLENNDLIIVDHKSGGDDPSQCYIRPFEFQLDSYKPLFHFGVQNVAGSKSFVHFIRAGEVKGGGYSTVEDIEGNIRKDLEWSFDGAVDHVKDLGFFKHIAGNHCKWCQYSALCKTKGKLLKPLELGTRDLLS